jgi:hypothetical protein
LPGYPTPSVENACRSRLLGLCRGGCSGFGSSSSFNRTPPGIAGVAANRASVSGGKPRGSMFSLCRLGVLVLDDGSGVRRLAPMAARYRELPPDRRAGRRTARHEDRPRRGRPPARRAIWHVLTPNRPFAPAGRPEFLAARRLSLRIGPRERSSHQPDPAAAGDGEISAAPTHDEGTTRPDHAGLDNRPLFMEKLFRFCARRGVGWWYWPCGHQPRPPESKDRRSATTRRRN